MFLAVSIVAALVALLLVVRWIEPRFAFFPSQGEDATPHESGVDFKPVSIDTSDGEKLRAWMMTPAAPRARIVYFHGNGGNLSIWMPCLLNIARRGYAVFAIDYRGYGVSTGRPTERGLHRDVDATVARAWADAASGKPLVYWGRSLGGSMAAYAATVRRPDGLVLESTFPEARAVVRGSPLSLLVPFASYRFAVTDYVNRTPGVPVLQLHGDQDSIIPFALGRELFASIREPKRFVVIPGADHNDDVPLDAAAYWSAIDSFINALRAP